MATDKATEVFFYHLERAPLELVLPNLLSKTLERGWRAVVQAGSPERLEALDTLLWTYDDASFLPHGRGADGHGERQPVFLTTGDENPNGAGVRFFVDGAEAADLDGYQRAVFVFDGQDETMVERARAQWKAAQEAGHDVTYWQQTAEGKWEKQA